MPPAPGAGSGAAVVGSVGVGGGAGAERADQGEAGVVDADQSQAGAADRLDQRGEHVAARGDRDDLDAARRPSPVTVGITCQSSTARSSGIGMWSWAAKRIAVSSSSAVLDQRQAQRAHGDPLVGDPDPHVARELVLGEQLLERVAEDGSGSCTSPSRNAPEAQRRDAVAA